MARMPTSLGERPIPQSRRGGASYDPMTGPNLQAQAAAIDANAGDNLARAVSASGDQLADLGQRQRVYQDRAELATAQSAFLRDKITADSAYDDDKDFMTIEKRYTEQVSKSQKAAASLIKDPLQRAAFEQSTGLEILRGQAQMKGLARNKEVDHGRAEIAQGIDQNTQAALTSSDSETRAGLLKANAMLVDSGIAKGYYSESEGMRLKLDQAHAYTSERQNQMSIEFDDRVMDINRQVYQTGDIDAGIVSLNKLAEGYAGSLPAEDLLKARRDAKDHLIQLGLLSPNLKPQDAMRMLNGSAPVDVPPILTTATPELVSAVTATENTPDGRASPAGAVGVMQILPETGREVAGKLGLTFDAKRLQTDPAYNTAIGTAYLNELLQRYGGNSMLAIAAYNAGPGRVDKWIQDHGDPRAGAISSADFIAQIPFDETRNYVTAALNRVGASSSGPPNVDNMKTAGVVKPDAANFNTALPPDQEAQFRQWVNANHVPFDPEAQQSDYDMRGFWKALQDKDPRAASAIDPNDHLLHYPDYWKTPLHKTFSNESQWAGPNAPHWTADDKLVTPQGQVVYDDRAGKPNKAYGAELAPERLASITNQVQGRIRDEDQAAAVERGLRQDDAKTKFTAHLASLTTTGAPLDGFDLEDYKTAFPPQEFEAMQRQEQEALRLNKWMGPIANGSPADIQRVRQEVAPVPGSVDFDQQVKDQAAVEKAIADRDKALKDDPALYVIQNDPQALAAFQQVEGADDPRPQAGADKRLAVETIKQAQVRMGVNPAEVRVMPAALADQLVSDIVNAPTDQVAMQLDEVAKDYGPEGLAQVASSKGSPPTVKLAAFADDPRDGLIRQRMIEAGRMKPEELNAAVKARGIQESDIDEQITAHVQPLLDTMPVSSAAPYIEGYTATVKYLVGRGMSAKEAASTAWAPFERAYVFRSTYRIPTAYDPDKVDKATDQAIKNLPDTPLEVKGGGDPLLGDEHMKAATVQDLRDNGVWVTNQNETGLVLTYGDDYGTPGDPVLLANGTKLEVLFANAVQPPPADAPVTPYYMGGASFIPGAQASQAAPQAVKRPPGKASPAGARALEEATGANPPTVATPFGDTRDALKFMATSGVRKRAKAGDAAAAAELKQRGL